ncbi:hypothetical protein [Polynucleobacter sp. Fuers-14]|uniref:DUF7940 domain-containing protein n=1 Tax=Polynucleobacter sp. Fuers-14 TaxID=1758364 RepID=UPI001C0BA46F|nr:hypothetical protein [Polynucleobacter sp. Fuers-14]MBU3640508.1 hypothetical protein [Polynucleobacter sp. Fuers-14]
MRIMLHPDWKYILRKAWSLKFIALSGLCSGLVLVLPFYQLDLPRNTFSLLLVFCSVLAPVFSVMAGVCRLVKQRGIDGQ